MTVSSAAYGAEEKWSGDVIGEAVLEGSLTAEDVYALCLNRAKAKAIEEVAGTALLRETLVVDYMKIADFIQAQSNAWIKEVKDVKWDDPIPAFRKTPESPPVTMYRVRLKALVVADNEGSSDFAIKLSLNETIFRNGEEMIISVRPTHDCYLTVFNILASNKVMVIVPSSYQGNRHAKKGMTYSIPDKGTMDNQRKLKMFNTSHMTATREAILVLATRHDVDLIHGDFVVADLRELRKPTGLFNDLLEKMMSIPPRDRALAVQYYEIRGKWANNHGMSR